jgi:hypothetical protein
MSAKPLLVTLKGMAEMLGISTDLASTLQWEYPQIIRRLDIGRGMYRVSDINKLIDKLAGEPVK